MKIDQNKSSAEKLGIELGVKLSRQGKSINTTTSSLTMLDTIGLALSIISLLALSQSMRIEFDNQNDTEQ